MPENNDKLQKNLKRPTSFSSYCGLEEIVVIPENFEKALEDRITKIEDNEFTLKTHNELSLQYNTIRICDTFFSDAFPLPQLRRLIKSSSELKFRLLLLNPFSAIAKMRANALEGDSAGIYRRMNKGLINILNGINNIPEEYDDYYETHKSYKSYTKQLLEQIKGDIENTSIKLELKFTEEYTDLPYYMIGFYVFKGMIFPDRSAKKNPWSIYVDDPLEDRDMFSTLERWFDILWDRAFDIDALIREIGSVMDKERSIFLSCGKDIRQVKEIQKIIQDIPYIEESQINYKSILLEQDFKDGETTIVPPVWHDYIHRCSTALVLLLGEDDYEGDLRARQNVIHELGYLQALFGEDKVLVILEEDLGFPKNVENQGDNFLVVNRNVNGDIPLEIISMRIRTFLSRLESKAL